jgi:cytochrome c-type biogenesis protein
VEIGPLAYGVAFGGGVASFLSPCVLPLVPAYLAVVSGVEVHELGRREHAWRIAGKTGLFVAGFAAVFVVLYLSSTALSHALVHRQAVLTRASGIVVVVLAVLLAASNLFPIPWLARERRLHVSPVALGRFTAPVAGAALAFGWVPCVGPVMGSVLAVAATQGRALPGALLLLAYVMGMGVCFLAAGLAADRVAAALRPLRRHLRGVSLASAGVMGFFGVLLVLNRFSFVVAELQAAFAAIGLGHLVNLG